MPITADDLEKELQEELARKAKNAIPSNINNATWVPQRCKVLLIMGMSCGVMMLFLPQQARFSGVEFPMLEQTNSGSASETTGDKAHEATNVDNDEETSSRRNTEIDAEENHEAQTQEAESAISEPTASDTSPGAQSDITSSTHEGGNKSGNKKVKYAYGGWRCSADPLGVSSWRNVIPSLVTNLNLDPAGDIYEFGVFDGGSMFMLKEFYPKSRLWGFDSFKGLPETKDDLKLADWHKGAYMASKTVEELAEKLGGPKVVQFIVGFYDKVLDDRLATKKRMRPASYIDMDADLFISSFVALNWTFAHGLVRVGTLIGYDDFWVSPCARGGRKLNPLQTGAGKAHLRISKAYKVKFRCVAGPCAITSCTMKHCCWGPIFLVEAIGGDTQYDTGFTMTSEEIALWKYKNLECVRHYKGWNMDVGPPR